MKFYHPIKGHITADELKPAEALVILSSIQGLGRTRILKLISFYGSATAVLEASAAEVCQQAFGSQRQVERFLSWEKSSTWKTDLELVDKHEVALITYDDSFYPKDLLNTNDYPLILYAKGDATILENNHIAIIGTRYASTYGMEMAHKFAFELAQCGYSIISGLARGIDTAAHNGALEGGKTIAVIGSGLANIYPRENQNLAEAISHKGVLLSEFPMTTPPDRQNFPQRNRVVAGMAKSIILIEAPIKSGAMITMQIGKNLGKNLYALPGRVDTGNFDGNHALIRSSYALLFQSAQDILGPSHCQTRTNDISFEQCKIKLDNDENAVFSRMPKQEISVEDLIQLTDLSPQHVNAILMSLLLKGVIKELPGRMYKKK